MIVDIFVFFLNVASGVACGAAAGWHFGRGNDSWAGTMLALMLLNIGLAVFK